MVYDCFHHIIADVNIIFFFPTSPFVSRPKQDAERGPAVGLRPAEDAENVAGPKRKLDGYHGFYIGYIIGIFT